MGSIRVPELRWSFILKVYSIIALQLLASIAVGAVVVSVKPISHFFTATSGGLACYIILIITPFIDVAFAEKVILYSAILTAAVVVSLTLYLFWAAKKGYDFDFLGLCVDQISIIQIFKLGVMICGCLASIIFCGCIVYHTDNLIKRYTYDQYI